MRPILSATGTYNYPLAMWLDEKLKPLSTNEFTISVPFEFSNEIRNRTVRQDDILVSYDVASINLQMYFLRKLFTFWIEKAFKDNWFNNSYHLVLSKDQLIELLRAATTNQLFQFDGILYEQIDGVAMGSPLGPLLANIFMCSLEDRLRESGQTPEFYKHFVDDSFSIMPNVDAGNCFLSTLNRLHPSINFTMEIAENDKLPFLGMTVVKTNNVLATEVYRKPTDTGLLLH